MLNCYDKVATAKNGCWVIFVSLVWQYTRNKFVGGDYFFLEVGIALLYVYIRIFGAAREEKYRFQININTPTSTVENPVGKGCKELSLNRKQKGMKILQTSAADHLVREKVKNVLNRSEILPRRKFQAKPNANGWNIKVSSTKIPQLDGIEPKRTKIRQKLTNSTLNVRTLDDNQAENDCTTRRRWK